MKWYGFALLAVGISLWTTSLVVAGATNTIDKPIIDTAIMIMQFIIGLAAILTGSILIEK